MGMDVYGCNPESEVGKYFRQSCWGWRPLWDYCCEVSERAASVLYGQSNDGDGLNASGAKRLAQVLREELASGQAVEYVRQRNETIEALPLETCELCHGTGKRNDAYVKGTCNACDGRGERKTMATEYSLEVRDIEEFAEFLENCGGFEIW